jgi:hypothetical protein
VVVATGVPHALQNFEFGGSSAPHDPHTKAAAVISRGRPLSFHGTLVAPLTGQHVRYRSRDGCATGDDQKVR